MNGGKGSGRRKGTGYTEGWERLYGLHTRMKNTHRCTRPVGSTWLGQCRCPYCSGLLTPDKEQEDENS